MTPLDDASTHHLWLVVAVASCLGQHGCGGRAQRSVSMASDIGDGASADGGTTSTGAGDRVEAGVARLDASAPDANDAVDGDIIVPDAGSALPRTGPTWRQSATPWCGGDSFSPPMMWSSELGIYVMGGGPERSLFFNGGMGWSKTPEQPDFLREFSYGLTGIAPAGPLIVSGTCIYFFDGHSAACAAAVGARVFAVDARHVYAVTGPNRIISYNGTYFTQYGSFPSGDDRWSAFVLWANADVVVVAGPAGQVYRFDGPSTVPQALPIPDGQDATSLWGFARDDLWVGGGADGRLAHYDGATWSIVRRNEGACSLVQAMWGADGVLFYATSHSVGRWRAGQFDTVVEVPCADGSVYGAEPGVYEQISVQGLWGTSPDEVFIISNEWTAVVSDRDGYRVVDRVAPDACGMWRLYWFDGQRIGPL